MTNNGLEPEKLEDVDLEEALALAEASFQGFRQQAISALSLFHSVNPRSILVMGFIARVQGLHGATVDAIRAENPHAAFTLLRSYSENAAAIAYLLDHPASLPRFLGDGHPVPIGRIKSHAKTHFLGFDQIYSVLSDYSHPNSRGLLASHRMDEQDDGLVNLQWQSHPRFKTPFEAKLACMWVVELTEAQANLIERLGQHLAAAAPENSP